MKTSIPSMKLGLASAIAVATLGMTGCGGDDNDSTETLGVQPDYSIVNETITSPVEKALICESDETTGARVICIGSNGLEDAQVQADLIDAISGAESGDTIVLPKGTYKFTQTINMTGKNVLGEKVDNITIKGAGMSQTILDFSRANGDGFLLDGSKTDPNQNYVFEDFGVYEAGNNAIKAKGVDGIIFRRMATVWQDDYQKTNGAYGLYPVETSNVLIEDCYVRGSADAGVYVGQSDNIVIRRNYAEKNVAGIEIENSTRADAYDNIAIGNTGGLLVFDLPIGNGKYGSGVRVFKNTITENNASNFANTGDFEGGVHIVPPGTGVIILSTSNVEIFDNTITDHKSISIALSSYLLPAGDELTQTPNDQATTYKDISKFASKFLDGWNPLVRGINIHDNTITNAEDVYAPDGSLINDLIFGYTISGERLPNIIYDGIGQLLSQTPLSLSVSGDELAAVQALYGDNPSVLQGLYASTLSAANAVAAGGADVENTPSLLVAGQQAYVGHGLGFGPLAATEGVCSSNNGEGVTQGAVFRVDYTKPDAFDGNGDPAPIFSEPDNDALNCGEGTPYTTPFVGEPVMLTINGEHYGCGSAVINDETVQGDDAAKAICAAN